MAAEELRAGEAEVAPAPEEFVLSEVNQAELDLIALGPTQVPAHHNPKTASGPSNNNKHV
eukprot:1284357-Pyramimonas_sp.AAC.1